MFWNQTKPDSALIDVATFKVHERIDCNTDAENNYIATRIAAATSHAEFAMECSLLTRTITATFFNGEQLLLPRGPIISITSVTLNGNAADAADYRLERYGNVDLLCYKNSWANQNPYPSTLVVIYQAGFGATPDDVPADITACVLAHAAALYENREAISDRTITKVPVIEDFYRLHSRGAEVG